MQIKYKFNKIILINPSSKEVEINDINNFCKENSFNRKLFGAFLSGNQKSFRGWRIKGTKSSKYDDLIIFRYGEEFKIINFLTFCKTYKLDVSSITKVLRGQKKIYSGFALTKEASIPSNR